MRFAFFCGENAFFLRALRAACSAHWPEVRELRADSFTLIAAGEDAPLCAVNGTQHSGAVAGWARRRGTARWDDSEASLASRENEALIEAIVKEPGWPLGEEWTGGFAAVGFERATGRLLVCNDLLGATPIYYTRVRGGVAGATHLIPLARAANLDADGTGLLQRLRLPYCNYGRRTIVRDVFRPLPGEHIEFRAGRQVRSRMDDSLCRKVISGKPEEVALEVWDSLRGEVLEATASVPRVGVALSGGWDSRLVLAGVADRGGALQCFTYGDPENYEPRLAARLADLVGARHHVWPIRGKLFPSREQMALTARESEAANILVWEAILQARRGRQAGRDLLLLGDHCESLDGRNLEAVSTREFRVRSRLRELAGRSERIPESDERQFAIWRERLIDEELGRIRRAHDRLAPAMRERYSLERVIDETRSDLEESLGRVEAQRAPFAPMHGELFAWFHKCRFSVASQNQILSGVFRAVSPTMSMHALRMMSCVHPALRMRRKLMQAIMRLPELASFARVPSAQVPWISGRAPGWLQDAVWAFRSGLDQALIRRMMRRRDPELKARVLKSLDWVAEYRRPETLANVESWFSGRWILAEPYLEKTRSRAELRTWPGLNVDIGTAGSLSIVLDHCLGERGEGAATGESGEWPDWELVTDETEG